MESWALLFLCPFYVSTFCLCDCLKSLVTTIATYVLILSTLLSSWICNYFPALFFMDNCYFRNWNVLCWDMRGLNSEARQRDLRAKIEESRCSVLCLQETKCENFDIRMIRSFCPRRFDQFAFSPSVGASGGILVIWNSSIFHDQLIDIQRFGVVVSFQSLQNSEKWTLASVYGPCEGQPRDDFLAGFII